MRGEIQSRIKSGSVSIEHITQENTNWRFAKVKNKPFFFVEAIKSLSDGKVGRFSSLFSKIEDINVEIISRDINRSFERYEESVNG